MDYCRKAHCLLPRGKLDGLCTQERYAHEPLPFQWPSCTSVWQVLTLEQTYISRSRWWHGTASRSFTPLQTPSSIGTPWQSAWYRDPDQPLSLICLVWSLPGKRLWNAKMKLIVRSFSRKRPIPDLPSCGLPPCLQECPSGCRLHHLLPSIRAHCLSSGIWSAMRITFICCLKSFHAATLSAALQFISGYFSLGTDGMISAIRRSFQDHQGNWMRAISVMVEDGDLTFGMYWGVLRQCPLVMAYRGRTNRNWIIDVTMCCPERTG